jgi:hypothetical protein
LPDYLHAAADTKLFVRSFPHDRARNRNRETVVLPPPPLLSTSFDCMTPQMKLQLALLIRNFSVFQLFLSSSLMHTCYLAPSERQTYMEAMQQHLCCHSTSRSKRIRRRSATQLAPPSIRMIRTYPNRPSFLRTVQFLLLLLILSSIRLMLVSLPLPLPIYTQGRAMQLCCTNTTTYVRTRVLAGRY